MEHNLSHQIQALLFATAEPQSFSSLIKRFSVSKEVLLEALAVLDSAFAEHAMMLVQTGEEVVLAIRPEYASLIESIRKEELSKELSKASAETLATVLYRPGISKAEIEFIRGVNVSYSLRALSMRGLIESRGAGRAVGYHPTVMLLEHFGIPNVQALPQYEETVQKINALLQTSQELSHE